MVTRVVDMETEKTSVPGQTYIVPTYYTYYGAYYGYSYRPGYTETTGMHIWRRTCTASGTRN